MRKQRVKTRILWGIVALVMLSTSGAWAARGSMMGKVKSVSDDKSSIVISRTEKDHKGEEATVTLTPKTRYYLYVGGDMSALKDGTFVKAYGKISEEMTRIDDIGHICVLPAKSNVTDKKRRLDGVLVVSDGKMTGIEHKGNTVPMTSKPKVSVEIVTVSSVDEIAVGRNVHVGGVITDGNMTKTEELRYYGAK